MLMVPQYFQYNPSLFSDIKAELVAVEDALNSCKLKYASARSALHGQSGFGVDELESHVNALGKCANQYKGNVIELRCAWRDIHNIVTDADNKAYRIVRSDGKSLLERIVKAAWDLSTAPIRLGLKVVKYTYDSINCIYKAFQPGGALYEVGLYLGAAYKVVTGAIKILGFVATVFGTAGGSTPLAIMGIIYGINDISNALTDFAYIGTQQYDEVGKHDWLKDRMQEGGGMIGKALGNEQLGESIGTAFYHGGNLVASIYAIDKSVNAITQSSSWTNTAASDFFREIKTLPGNLWELGKVNLGDLAYQFKLFTYEAPQVIRFLGEIGKVKALYSSIKGFESDLGSFTTDIVNQYT